MEEWVSATVMWISTYIANLLFGSVFQTFTVVSEEAETVFEPSSVTATAFTAAVWPFITCIHSALDTHQYLQYVEQFTCECG